MKKFIIFLIFALCIFTGIFFLYKYVPNAETVSYSYDEPTLIIEDDVITDNDDSLLIEDNNIFLSYDTIKKFIDPNIFYDENEGTIVITTINKVIKAKINEDKASVNEREVQLKNSIIKFNNILYIPIELFPEDYKTDIRYIKERNTVIIDFKDRQYPIGEVYTVNGTVRTGPSIKSPLLLGKVEEGSKLLIFEEYDKWYKIRTEEGIVGFIEKRYVKKDLVQKKGEEVSDGAVSEKINITWDYIGDYGGNIDKILPVHGLDIICPTFFSITDKDGTIKNKGNQQYVSKYQSLGYKVWGLVSNSFDPDVTGEVLKNTSSREQLINKLLEIYINYGLDGINIDFENVYLRDKELLTQFVRELTPIFKEHNMVVSIDVTPISSSENWSKFYDRVELARIVDYIVIMTYDQYWAASPNAGSVAQYTWVEESIKNIINEVPNNKLILGIPYYTRLWKTDSDGKLSSVTLSMDAQDKFVADNNMIKRWDKESGQFYGEVDKEGENYKIWLEDENSIKLKTSLVNKYDLAGVASWRKGYEKEEIWETISNNIRLN